MRVAIVRSDVGHMYLDDIENTSQRDFSSEPAGQSRYLHRPTDAELTAILAKYSITLVTLPLATLRAAVYPTAVTVNVASATLTALAGISALAPTAQAACVADLQNAIAPSLVETGPVLLSFVYGVLSKMKVATFQPGGTRGNLPAGIAAAIVANDGSTVYTV